jgi:uncharacterized membrane protein
MSKTAETTRVSLAVAAALAIVSSQSGHVAAEERERERCYGISPAGENDCASAPDVIGEHDCAGAATIDYNGQDWRLVPAGTCAEPGSTEPFDGVGGPLRAGQSGHES